MKIKILFIFFLLFFFSCEKSEVDEFSEVLPNFSSEINFEISEHLTQGTKITNIEFSESGYYYSSGNKIFYGERNKEAIMILTASSYVNSMAFNREDNSLYFGTHESGLGKLNGSSIQYFTVENSNLPLNIIREVECDNDGNVWFSSSSHQSGGLVKYDGRSFFKYLPENSMLPGNLIYNIAHRNGKIYVTGTITGENRNRTLKIDGYKWHNLYICGSCFQLDLVVDSKENIYFINDSRDYCGGGLLIDLVVFKYSQGQKNDY